MNEEKSKHHEWRKDKRDGSCHNIWMFQSLRFTTFDEDEEGNLYLLNRQRIGRIICVQAHCLRLNVQQLESS
ncbi:unnamed protein product [Lactuca virosa]|uniref:Uncharacterized protein n=1 Tax=Lactuca virosa TaxID=75947 RepID=A0AAU9PBF5_9ASTR|nr:unnamed protein product [Lactuca virosa]